MLISSYDFPSISIVTPSFNQAEFLEHTIDSVLSQGYPGLQYLIIDGGSTDGSVEIIQRHQQHLSFWCSEPDGGPWAAILKGVQHCRGAWFNWLNADDLLLPGSLALLAELIRLCPDAPWITGARLDIDALGRPVSSTCPWIRQPTTLIYGKPFLPQDATFMRLEFFLATAAQVPCDLHNLFDTVLHHLLWARQPPLFTTTVFSAMRWHGAQRTAQADRRLSEAERPDVQASRLPLPPLPRLLRRLSRTRLHRFIDGLAWQLGAAGLANTLELSAAVYDPWQQRYVLSTVAEALARGDF